MGLIRNALFEAPNQRSFENSLAVADVVSILAMNRRMKQEEILASLVTNICSIIQARAEPSEWGMAADQIADAVKRKLTVTGDTGDDHHARRQV